MLLPYSQAEKYKPRCMFYNQHCFQCREPHTAKYLLWWFISVNHASCLDKSNPQLLLFHVEQWNKEPVSIASISRGRDWEATGMRHPLAGFTVTSRWTPLPLRSFAVEVSCPNHFHLKLIATSQEACPRWCTGDPLVTSGPLPPIGLITPAHSTVVGTDMV